jgi:RNA polymerase sigma-70 factor (ECF subfamily)
MEPGDDSKLRAAAGGNERAAGELYDRHAPGLYRFLVLMLGDHQAAEDALQETFAYCFRNAARYDPQLSALGVWLRQVAFNLARNELRRRRRKPAVSLDTLVPSEGRLHPLSELLAGKDRGAARRNAALALELLALLPEEARQVLVLRFVEGLAPREISTVLGLKPKAVSMRIWRAIQELQEKLERERADSP